MQVDLTGVSVVIAMPVFNDIPPQTVRSLLETQAACNARGIVLDIELRQGSTVFHARSIAAHRFLNNDKNRLFMIDSDMVWSAEAFFRMLALSTKMDCVSASYTSRSDPPKFYIGLSNTQAIEPNEFGCIPIDGVGLGFTVVTRKIIEELAAKAPRLTFSTELPGESVAKIFRFDEPDGEARGEDMAFFGDVKALGYQPWLDLDIELGHIGAREYRARFLDYLVRK